MATEYWFYHLEASTLEGVLPNLLEKTRDRGWRSLVVLDAARVGDIDDHLWTYRDESFLPHGRDDEPMTAYQPVVLSSDARTADGFDAVFLCDGAELADMAEAKRCLVLFNGRSEDAVKAARAQWKSLKDSGADLAYWQQSQGGQWKKQG